MQIPFFSRWHPTLALRYLPMLKYINSQDSVLEVGSGSLGIGPYLRRKFTGADIEFQENLWQGMKQVKASAIKLPFDDKSFDVVVNSDMLEHLPERDRQKAINEMMRVTKKTLIIGVPIGDLAHQQDRDLDDLYLKTHGKRHQFLQEQTDFGLPNIKDIKNAINLAAKKSKKTYDLKITPNMNLSMRMWLMRGWISRSMLVDIFFRKVLLPVIPIMRQINQNPVYRQIFIVHIKNFSSSQ